MVVQFFIKKNWGIESPLKLSFNVKILEIALQFIFFYMIWLKQVTFAHNKIIAYFCQYIASKWLNIDAF